MISRTFFLNRFLNQSIGNEFLIFFWTEERQVVLDLRFGVLCKATIY